MYNLVTQSQVVTFLRKHLDLLGGKKDKPVGECKHFFKEVVSVQEDATAIDAFNLMVDRSISGVAILDSKGNLKDNLSLRDMKLISYDARLFWRLKQTVKNFLIKLKAEWESRHERPQKAVFATRQNTLEEMIKMLADNKIHRVYIIESEHDKKPIGVVSLKDVLLEILI